MKLDDEEIARVCRLVDDVAGIQWDASKTYLIESRLPALLTEFGCQSLSDLVNLVRQGSNPRVRTAFIDAVTTRETLFFRDQGPFDALKHKCLPEILDAKAKTPYAQRLRIWSAACSSGQEPYSLGIILHELLDDLTGWDIQILATDISPAALKSAKTGIYSEFEMSRGVPQNLRDKYFTRVGDGWQVIDSVRRLVSFEHRNLLEPLANMGPFDVVFCRNVAIYFEADVRADLFERVSGVMAPHGALFVGGSENLAALGEKWKPLYHCRGIFYLPNRKNVGPVASIDVVGPGKTAIATASRTAQPPARLLTTAPASPARPAAGAQPVQVTAGRAAPPVIGNRSPSPAAGSPVARPVVTATAARPATPPVRPAATSSTTPATTRPAAAPVARPVGTTTTSVRPTPPAAARPAVTASVPTSTATSTLAKPATPTARTALTGQPAGIPPKAAIAAPAAKPITTAARPGVTTTTPPAANKSVAPQPAAMARPTTTARPAIATRPATTQTPTPVQKPASVATPKPLSTATTRPAATVGITGAAKAAPAIPAKTAAVPTKPVTTTTARPTTNAIAPPKHLAGRPAAPVAKPR